MIIKTLKGTWVSWNKFIPEGTQEPLEVVPYGYINDEQFPDFPFEAFANIKVVEVKVRKNCEDIIERNYVLIAYLKIEDLEHNSFH